MTGFSNSTLKGDYGFQDQGTRKEGNGLISYSALRTANFDGNGNHVGKGMVVIDGNPVGYTVTGTYKVNSDGTFSLDATQTYEDGRASQPYKQFGVVIRGGNEILVTQTTDGKNQNGKYQSQTDY